MINKYCGLEFVPIERLVKQISSNIGLICHVGAHLGEELPLYQELDPSSILLIEADPDMFTRLQKSVYSALRNSRYSADKVKVVNALVSDKSEETEFYKYSNDGASSSVYQPTQLLESTWPYVKATGEKITLKGERLDLLLINHASSFLNSAFNNILIIDTQGHELSVLRSLGSLIASFSLFEIEVSTKAIYEGAPLLNEIIDHFSLHEIVPITRIEGDYSFHGNMLFAAKSFLKSLCIMQASTAPAKAIRPIESITCQIPSLYSIIGNFIPLEFGFFVEVGGYDGETYSNTSGLADIGWKGIYIEPHPEYAERCRKRHHNNLGIQVINKAVSQSQGIVNLIIGEEYSTLSYEEANTSRQLAHVPYGLDQVIPVETDTINNILLSFNVPPDFDVLVVDVEGLEYEVFQNFDFSVYSPKIIIVELKEHNPFYSSNKQLCMNASLCRSLILDNQYSEIYRDTTNTIFVKR